MTSYWGYLFTVKEQKSLNIMVSGNRFLQIIHSFLQKILKIVSPLLLPLLKFQNLPLPPHPFLPKIFNLCITSLPKMTTNTLSPCITSYDSHEQKQVSRSKLIIQIHKNIQFTIIYQGIGNSLYFKQKIFYL